jgi:hypothetical protein
VVYYEGIGVKRLLYLTACFIFCTSRDEVFVNRLYMRLYTLSVCPERRVPTFGGIRWWFRAIIRKMVLTTFNVTRGPVTVILGVIIVKLTFNTLYRGKRFFFGSLIFMVVCGAADLILKFRYY